MYKPLIISKKYPAFFLLIFMIAISIIAHQRWFEKPANHISHYIGLQKWKISGTVSDNPSYRYPKTYVIINVTNLQKGENSHNVYGKIRLSIWGKHEHLKKGLCIKFTSRLLNFNNFKNPGGFDYKYYMNFHKNIDAYAYAKNKQIQILDFYSECNIIEKLTDNFCKKISQMITNNTSNESSGFLHAIILGKRNQLSQEINDIFISTGIVHLLAISGLHMGMIAITAFVFFRWLFRRSENLCLYGLTDYFAAILSFVLMAVYFLISGMSPATQRAFIMISVFLLSQIIYREQQSLNTLCFAAFLILSWDVRSLTSISFQMSFIAVFIIILGFKKLSEIIKDISNYSVLNYVGQLFVCSLFGIIATAPLSMHYFYHTSWMGLFTNLFAIPIVGLCILPFLFFSILMIYICEPFANKLISLSGFFADQLIAMLKCISNYSEPFEIYCHLSCFEIFCWYCLVILILTGYSRYKKYLWIIILLFIMFDTFYWVNQRFFQRDVRVTILDVHKGNAVLVELPGGDCLMIDGGGMSSSFDIGKHVVAPYLWRNKIKSVNTLILTHPDRDHLQGFLFVAKHFYVKSVWSNGDKKKTELFKEWIEIINQKRIHNKIIHANCKESLSNVDFTFFNPPKLNNSSKLFYDDTNNNSLVVQLKYKDNKFLFTGDIEYEAESFLVQNSCDSLKSDILLCPHHGSRTSSTKEFINCVKPELVIISTRKDYKNNLPNPKVIARYLQSDCIVKRTDIDGAIIINLSKEGWEINNCKNY